MINIYICEDDLAQLDYLSHIIKNYLLIEQLEDYFHCATPDPYILIKELSNTEGTGLYFLDIDLHSDITGLELAAKIRQYDPRGYIVFITTHDEMLPLTFTYKVEAMDFIQKDLPNSLPERIIQCIQTALKTEKTIQAQSHHILSIRLEHTIFQINQNDIVLIESDNIPHKLIIHTTNGVKRISGSLKDIQASLDNRFHRCHNSTIVNIGHVISYHPEKRLLQLDNGENCLVSFRFSRTIRSLLSYPPAK